MKIKPTLEQVLPGRWGRTAALDHPSPAKLGHEHTTMASLVVAIAVLLSGLMLTDAAQAAPVMGVGYHIKFRHSGKCLDVPAGATTYFLQLQQYTCIDTDNQRFQLEWADTDLSGRAYYRLRNVRTSQCVDTNWGINDWDSIMQYPCGTSWKSQWFTLIHSDGMPVDYYKLVNYYSEKCVNVPYASSADSTKIIQYACEGYWPQGTENMQVRFLRFP
jgi:hypothetical protein